MITVRREKNQKPLLWQRNIYEYDEDIFETLGSNSVNPFVLGVLVQITFEVKRWFLSDKIGISLNLPFKEKEQITRNCLVGNWDDLYDMITTEAVTISDDVGYYEFISVNLVAVNFLTNPDISISRKLANRFIDEIDQGASVNDDPT